MNNIFDTHAHYDDERFDVDRDSLIPSMLSGAVAGIINVGCDVKSSKAAVALANRYERVYAAVGLHPEYAENTDGGDVEILRRLTEEKKVVAIGEIGLDYHYEPYSRETQLHVFEAQLILAKEVGLPVIIHSRDATEDTLALLKKHRPKGTLHCFTGSAETAKTVLGLGMYLGFTGVLSFKNSKKAKEVVKIAPIDRLLLETDCPYMAPEPYRGQRCQSTMISETAAAMAAIKGIPPQEMADVARENALRLFEKIDINE